MSAFSLIKASTFSSIRTYCCSSFVRALRSSYCFSHPRLFSSSGSGTFMEVVKAACRHGSANQDRVAIITDQENCSYKQLVSYAMEISRLLSSFDLKTNNKDIKLGLEGHGVLSGARVGIIAKPSAEFVASVLGTWFSGGVAVPLAVNYPETELLHVISDSEISVILSTGDYRESLQSVAEKSAVRFSLIPSVTDIISPTNALDQPLAGEIDLASLEKVQDLSQNPALIVYTSGTTGKPKGVVHTHGSIKAQVQMLAEAWEYTSSDQFLHCLPLHHVHGLFNALLAPLYAGATVEFLPKFSVRGVWQKWRDSYPLGGSIADNAITVFTGVPTMYSRLIQGYEAMEPELKLASASAARHLRLMMCGSSALPQPVMQDWEAITGHRLLERYGMTEFVMALSNPLNGTRKAGTVGKPFPGVQVKIEEEKESSNERSAAVGELCIKSPSMFKEYWNLPEVTSTSFTADGFFRTGDAARVDEDGYFIILGRTSADIMKVGGYKLSALEIESVLLEHPGIAECCVLGLPDKDYGEAVTAIVVLESDIKPKQAEESSSALSLEELCRWAKDKLAPYKLPTRLIVWDSLPRNAMGKVNKKELKKVLANQQ